MEIGANTQIKHLVALLRYTAICVVLSLNSSQISADPGSFDEGTIRAVIIFKILRFTEWQEFSGEHINICSAGEGNSLEKLHILNGKRIRNRTLRTRENNEVSRCHVMVLGNKNPPTIEKNASGKLVVCDGCTNPPKIASVELISLKNKVGFNIDLAAAALAGVNISSDLLLLANEVRGRK